MAFQTENHYKYLSDNESSGSNASIWGIDQKKRMKGESSHLLKLQMMSRVIQIGMADSVINDAYKTVLP